MADDPGSSVLTVSALGLTKRSLSPSGADDSHHIALWKDQINGWREIAIKPNEGGVVLTIAAHWREEFTADGRGDENNAAVLVLEGTHPIEVKHNESESKPRSTTDFRVSEPRDLLEISLFSYFVDAVLDASPEIIHEVRNWVLGEDNNGDLQQLMARHSLLKKIQLGVKNLLIESNREDFRPFVEWFSNLIQRIPRPVDNTQHPQSKEIEYYTTIVSYASQILEAVGKTTFLDRVDTDDPFVELSSQLDIPRQIPPERLKHRRVRVCIYSCLALLWAVHTRLNGLRRKGLLNRESTNLLSKIEELLQKDYDRYWYEAINRFQES